MLHFARRSVAAMAVLSCLAVPFAAAASTTETEVLAADDAYRVAKLHQDIRMLEHILAEQFSETNQNGNSRNKAQTVELWRTFSIRSFTTDRAEVRVNGDVAVVLGAQTEDRAPQMLFSRVYRKFSDGWKLLSSTQFDNPQPGPVMSRPNSDVFAVDEAYRAAKLHQDTAALKRILSEEFNETNQNGNSRNKAQTLELWQSFSIASLTTDSCEIRVSDDAAVVTGKQTENGTEHMLFTRVYIRRDGTWRLSSSMQFRDPQRSAPAI